jgi:Tol biopolymer transport system component
MIGKIISHYKILEKLGESKMGVVYKALDTQLDHAVALRFLPQNITQHTEDWARFLQEVKTFTAVRHPNVCAIYDIGEHEGRQFIVMEYIDGKTLRQKLPVPNIQNALDYAIQIGEALQEVHRKGIVHLDVMTDNIIVNTTNQVKVMDLGSAKLKRSLKLAGTSNTVRSLAYMSPEQIRDKEVDGRADIFLFGVVLYEMLAGEMPFPGDDQEAIRYSIVNEEPQPIVKFRSGISPEVLHILNRSLEKNPDERYQSVQDMLIDLKRAKKEISQTPPLVPSQQGVETQSVHASDSKADPVPENGKMEHDPPEGRKISKKRLGILTALACFLVFMIFLFFFKPFSKKSFPPMKIVPFTSSLGNESDPAFSPDGDYIAYVWNGDIYVKLIGLRTPLKLTRTPGNYTCPVWSPDSRFVAFLQSSSDESGIYKIPAMGGIEQRLLAIDPTFMTVGLDWSPDGGFMVYSDRDPANVSNGIFIITLANMEKRQITFPPYGTRGDNTPMISPNGRWIAFLRQFSWETSDIFVIPFSGVSEKRITMDNKNIADLAWSPDGSEIIFSSNRGGPYSLWRIPFGGGEPTSISAGVEDARSLGVSRKGHRLAYTKEGWKWVIWKGEIPKTEGRIAVNSRLVATNQSVLLARFSPDGREIAYSSFASGNEEIWMCDSDGSNPMQLTNFNGPPTGSASWSPDNQYIAFDSRPQGHSDIFIMNMKGGQLRCMTTGTFDESMPTWSRDGRWIYFTSNRSGSYGIWKCPVEGGEAIQVSKEGGFCNFESQDAKWLYYRDTSDKGNIWKLSLENGQKVLVLDNVGSAPNWILAEDGLYYTKESSDGNGSDILFFSFKLNSIKKLGKLQQKGVHGFDISPDRASFLISELSHGDHDIYLVEKFQ